MGDRRVVLSAGAVLVGVGSALLSGASVAAADAGDTEAGTRTAAGKAEAGPARSRSASGNSTASGNATRGTQRTSAPAAAQSRPTAKDSKNAAAPAIAPAAAAPDSASRVVAPLLAPVAAHAAAAVPVTVVTTRRGGVVTSMAAATAAPAAAETKTAAARELLTTALSALGWGSGGGEVATRPTPAAFTGPRQPAAPASVVGTRAVAAAPPNPDPAAAQIAVADVGPLLPGYSNGVTGVQTGHSRLDLPGAFIGDTVSADWYFPTQGDGSVQAQGVIWLQHGFGATNTFYSALAEDLARQTNSIVVAPTLSSFPFTFSGGCLICDTSQQAAAAAFLDPSRTVLVDSAVAAGYTGDVDQLLGKFVLAGHSAGGGFATATAADFIGAGTDVQDADLAGVVMFDGVSNGALDGSLAQQLATLDGVPVYQIAAPAQTWNFFGATTNVLAATRPDEFVGVVLDGGSHVDSMLGVNPIFDAVLQLVTKRVPAGNTAATYALSTGWINDMYNGYTPADPQYGLYAAANQQIIMGPTAALGLPSLQANMLSFGDSIIKGLVDAVGGLFGFQVPAPVNTGSNGLNPAEPVALVGNGVTGVRTGGAVLTIPSGDGYSAPADWYFPTQADGSVQANGLIWLQHGFLGFKSWYADMAMQLAQETNSIVVVPQIFWFDPAFSGQAAAQMFTGARSELNVSANAAGFQGVLPQKFILTGHSAGGNFATVAGAGTVDNGAAADLLGVVMFDGVSRPGVFAPALAKLDSLGIPDYQIAAKPQPWNAWGRTTEELAQLHPDQFIGTMIDNGSHTDVVAGSSLFADLAEIASDLIVRVSPDGAKAAVRTFAGGWINDIYAGNGPGTPFYGTYGNPNDGTYVPNQSIVMGDAGAGTLPSPPPVDVNQYAGTWYEQGSVRQFFSIGLVNTKAQYTPNPDGSIKVENSGNYFGPNGPAVNIVGSALPVNSPTNTRLSVAFFLGQPGTSEPGNYWILDYAPDYSWAIVGDSIGFSGYILTREQTISDAEYATLVARAQQLGVWGPIFRTQQYPTSA